MNKTKFEQNKNFLKKFILSECIEKPEQFMFGKLPGTRYSRQYYLANGLYNTEFLEKVTDCFYFLIKEKIGNFEFQIAGREWSSIPLLTSIPLLLKIRYGIVLNSFMIKRERKKYGKHNYIEGTPNNLPVLIVDDLSNSTDSFVFCHSVCENLENLKTTDFIFSVLNKYFFEKVGEDMYCDRYLKSHKILSILTGDDLINNDFK